MKELLLNQYLDTAMKSAFVGFYKSNFNSSTEITEDLIKDVLLEYKHIKDKVDKDQETEICIFAQVINEALNESILEINRLCNYYYKDKNNPRTSVKIEVSPYLTKIVAAQTDSLIKSKILMRNPIKTSYVAKNNLNFLKEIKEVEGNCFNGINKSTFRKILIKIAFSNINSKNKYFAKIWSGNELHKLLLRRFMSQVNSLMRTEITRNDRAMDGAIRNVIDTKFRNKAEISKLMFLSADVNEGMKFSKLINNTYSQTEDYTKLIEKTSVVKTRLEKTAQGTTITVRYREPKAEIIESQIEKVKKDIQTYSDTICFFESIENYIKINKISEEPTEKNKILFLSGAQIIAAYNISSYEGNKYNEKRDCTLGGEYSEAGGSLYGSCMRKPENKNGIDFYAMNDNFIKLMVLSDDNGKTIKARAVTWFDAASGVHYVDRIFYSTQDSLLRMIQYINKTELFYTISSVNVINALLRQKYKQTFAIKITSVKRGSSLPYFDTLDQNLYKSDSKEGVFIGRYNYLGRPWDNESYSVKADGHDGTFKGIGTVSTYAWVDKHENKKTLDTEIRCSICGERISRKNAFIEVAAGPGQSSSAKIVCRNHIVTSTDGKTYINASLFGTRGVLFKENTQESDGKIRLYQGVRSLKKQNTNKIYKREELIFTSTESYRTDYGSNSFLIVNSTLRAELFGSSQVQEYSTFADLKFNEEDGKYHLVDQTKIKSDYYCSMNSTAYLKSETTEFEIKFNEKDKSQYVIPTGTSKEIKDQLKTSLYIAYCKRNALQPKFKLRENIDAEIKESTDFKGMLRLTKESLAAMVDENARKRAKFQDQLSSSMCSAYNNDGLCTKTLLRWVIYSESMDYSYYIYQGLIEINDDEAKEKLSNEFKFIDEC